MQLCHKQLRPGIVFLLKIKAVFAPVDNAGGQYVPKKNVLNGINTLVNISSFKLR
jgi:hypothetical protein